MAFDLSALLPFIAVGFAAQAAMSWSRGSDAQVSIMIHKRVCGGAAAKAAS